VTLPQTLIFVGNDIAGPPLVAIMQPTIPVWTTLGAAAVGLERLTWRKAGGVGLSVAGALVLVGVWGLDVAGDSTALGTLVMLVQSGSYAFLLVALGRFFRSRPAPFAAQFLCTLSGLVLACGAAAPWARDTAWAAVPPWTWAAVAWAGAAVSFGAHSMNVWAVRHAGGVVPSVYVTLQPVLTVTGSVLLLGESLRPRHLVGFCLIVGGLWALLTAQARETALRRKLQAGSGVDLVSLGDAEAGGRAGPRGARRGGGGARGQGGRV